MASATVPAEASGQNVASDQVLEVKAGEFPLKVTLADGMHCRKMPICSCLR